MDEFGDDQFDRELQDLLRTEKEGFQLDPGVEARANEYRERIISIAAACGIRVPDSVLEKGLGGNAEPLIILSEPEDSQEQKQSKIFYSGVHALGMLALAANERQEEDRDIQPLLDWIISMPVTDEEKIKWITVAEKLTEAHVLCDNPADNMALLRSIEERLKAELKYEMRVVRVKMRLIDFVEEWIVSRYGLHDDLNPLMFSVCRQAHKRFEQKEKGTKLSEKDILEKYISNTKSYFPPEALLEICNIATELFEQYIQEEG